MAKIYCHPWCVFACVMTILFGFIGDDFAQASSSERSCTVREVLDADGYSYIRCQEGSSDVWIGTIKISVSVGEQISFTDAPPMVNFQSKSLRRSFPGITFTGVTRSSESQSNFSKSSYRRDSVQKESTQTDNDSIFSGSDEKGTIVFSDDPSKVPTKRQKNNKDGNSRKNASIVANTTDSSSLSIEDRKLLPILQRALTSYCAYDMKTLRSITMPTYWGKLKRTIDKEGNAKSAVFFQMFCFKEFKAQASEHFNARFDLDNKVYTTTNVALTGIRAGSEDEEGCTASFVKQQSGWKYVDIICGAGIGYPLGFRQP